MTEFTQHPDPEGDPTLKPIEDLINTMGGEGMGSTGRAKLPAARQELIYPQVGIIRATPGDAEEIGRLRARNWTEQYANLEGVTPEWMDSEIARLTGDEITRMRAHWIEQANKPDATNYWLVAKGVGGQALVGFLEARKHPDGKQEIRSLHIDSSQRGLGIGQELMDAARREWLDPAVDTFLDVAEANIAGQRFYKRAPNNFEFTGHRFMYGPVVMLRMVRRAA